MQKSRRLNAGFTIIELMVATTVFSIILLLCSAVLIQMGRIYQKGLVTNQTQEVARSIMSEVSEAIQFSSGPISQTTTNPDGTRGYCMDNQRLSYRTNVKLVDGVPAAGETNYAMLKDSLPGCSAATQALPLTGNPCTAGIVCDELLSTHMQLVELTICAPGQSGGTCTPGTPGTSDLYKVVLRIAYGDVSLLDGSQNCVSSSIGGSFCSTVNLSTIVQKRIK